MAKVIDSLPKKAGGIGRKSKYSYETWLDGQIWQLDSGEDFKGKPESMRANINNAAHAKGLKVRSRIVIRKDKNGKVTYQGLVVQSYTPESSNGNAPAEDAPAATDEK